MAWNGQVRTIERTWLEKVLQADPEFYAKRKDELLYEFDAGRRQFRGDPNRVGTAYPDE